MRALFLLCVCTVGACSSDIALLSKAPGSADQPSDPTTTLPAPATTTPPSGSGSEATTPPDSGASTTTDPGTTTATALSCGAPTSAPCGPGQSVLLGYAVDQDAMYYGASYVGAGECCGQVEFAADLSQVGQAAQFDYATSTVNTFDFNGTQGACADPHCNTLYYDDGAVRPNLCTLFAYCENGVATTVGYSW